VNVSCLPERVHVYFWAPRLPILRVDECTSCVRIVYSRRCYVAKNLPGFLGSVLPGRVSTNGRHDFGKWQENAPHRNISVVCSVPVRHSFAAGVKRVPVPRWRPTAIAWISCQIAGLCVMHPALRLARYREDGCPAQVQVKTPWLVSHSLDRIEPGRHTRNWRVVQRRGMRGSDSPVCG